MFARRLFIQLLCLLSGLTAVAQSQGAAGADAPQSRLMRNVLVWNSGSLMSWEPLHDLDINVLHTLPKPDPEDGISNNGLKPVPMLKEAINNQWRSELDQLHSRGIRVWASVPSTGFVPARFEQYGLDPELYYARDPEGTPASMLGGSYGQSVMTSCYNNPHWMQLIAEIVLLYADSGFDGVWYDVGGFADNSVFFCHCEHCQADWKARLVRGDLPPDTEQPSANGGKNYNRKVNREHFRWRLRQWEENFGAIRDTVKSRHPDFVYLHNQSALSTTMYTVGVKRLYDLPHLEEWGHSAAPYSLLPSYLLGRAMMADLPPVLIQNDRPRRNPLQHRIAMAEAYASGGVPQNRTHPEVNQKFYEYLSVHEDLYVNQESAANVAVVTSFWSRYFYELADRPAHEAPKPQYWTGWLLQDMHVPYDYLVAEMGLTPEKLQRYQLLILPDLAVIDQPSLESLRHFIEAGGRVLATGNTARYNLEMEDHGMERLGLLAGQSPTPRQRIEVGNGRFIYLDGRPFESHAVANPRDLNANSALEIPGPPPADFSSAMEWLLEGVPIISLEARNTTAIVANRKNGRLLLNLINYNVYPDGATLTPDTDIRATAWLPPGASEASARAISPDWHDYEREIPVSIADGRVKVTLDELSTHAVIVLNFK